MESIDNNQLLTVVDCPSSISITGRPGEKGKNSGLESLQREIAILKKVDHPYIVSLYEVCLLMTTETFT